VSLAVFASDASVFVAFAGAAQLKSINPEWCVACRMAAIDAILLLMLCCVSSAAQFVLCC
jgi:hypothetical protein